MSKQEAALILSKQFKELQKDPSSMFSAGLVDDDIFKWRVTIIGPTGTPYEGGVFPAILEFPETYPNFPPTMKFICPMFHPNIKADNGSVCISILHSPGKDQYEYEDKSERWLPIHTVESILISVVSMLSDPNPESPMNVEAAKLFNNDRKEYNRRVRRTAEDSVNYT